MSRPIALCVERVRVGDQDRYVRCTARPGRDAGLALGCDGTILWCHPGPVACEIWVSRDQRLVAFRPSGAPPVRLERARRGLDLPLERPVFLLDQDELVLDAQRFVVHVHGVTDDIEPPRPVAFGPRAAAVAAAIALGAAAVECGDPGGASPAPTSSALPAKHVPAHAVPRLPDGGTRDANPDGTAVATGDANDDVIEVREQPPE